MLPPFGNAKTVKEKIIQILSNEFPLSARKIYNKIKNENSVSYQAVHKALKELVDENIVEKSGREYLLNVEWIRNLKIFVYRLNKFYEIVNNNTEDVQKINFKFSSNYLVHRLRAYPVSFIPFYAGKPLSLNKLDKFFNVKFADDHKIIFQNNDKQYHWFRKTGIIVQVSEGKRHRYDILNFLLSRRNRHLNILNNQSHLSKDIEFVVDIINKSRIKQIIPKIYYVMSIYFVELDETIDSLILNNLLKMMTLPSILGITDNPNHVIDDNQLSLINKKLRFLENRALENSNIWNISISDDKLGYASWSNVVICCKRVDEKHIKQILTDIEIELQHLWFYFYYVKNIVKFNADKYRDIYRCCIELWERFNKIEPTYDSQFYIFKRALIETSQIKDLFNNLKFTHKNFK